MKIEYVPAGPIANAFHLSEAFVRGLMGPVGSSKSSACCIEIFRRGCVQGVYGGVRRTRWAVVRATYPELKSTTLKTWQEWFPGQVAPMRWDAPITSVVNLPLGDGSRVEIEVLFFPVETPADIEKLSSLEITGAWINEARELPVEVLHKLTERVGRFPPVKEGGASWRGVIMDTNAPDDDSWWYGLAEGSDAAMAEQMAVVEEKLKALGYLRPGQKLYEFFKQPGGLIEVRGALEPNPAAENIANLDGGYAYYFRQAAGKKKNWIKAQILGQYATTHSGRAVYEDHYNDDTHCKDAGPIRGLPLIIGQDYGRTPAAAICQITKDGQFRIIDELVAVGMGARVFARDILKPHLAQFYRDYQNIIVGDPSGNDPRDTEEKTCFQIFAEEGLPVVPALTNEQMARIEALSYFMDLMRGGEPQFLVTPRARAIRKGLNGGYFFERVQVSGERFRDVPAKNKYSHPLEAAQYAALHCRSVNVNAAWGKPIQYPRMKWV